MDLTFSLNIEINQIHLPFVYCDCVTEHNEDGAILSFQMFQIQTSHERKRIFKIYKQVWPVLLIFPFT